MPTDFDTQLIADVAGCFTGRSEFEETVTYTTPGGTATSGVLTVYQEYLGAIDEKTQAVFILPVATIANPERGATITRSSGEVWQVIDVSQRDVAAVNVRAVLPQLTT
jgi:hypothetical protein